MAKKAQLGISPEMWKLYLLLMLLFFSGGLFVWKYDWSKFKSNFDNLEPDTTPRQTTECPKTSADMKKPCCMELGSGKMQAAVGAVYVSASCKQCPVDTHFLQYAPESSDIMICECNACPN